MFYQLQLVIYLFIFSHKVFEVKNEKYILKLVSIK